jgi:hypothetical protein
MVLVRRRLSKVKRVHLETQIVGLLIDIAHHGLVIDAPAFAPVVGGEWAGLDLAGYSGQLRLDRARLTLDLDVPSGDALGPLYRMLRVRNQPSTIRLDDVSEVSAELTHMRRLGEGAEIHLYHWAWSGLQKPSVWLGQLRGELPQFGNLALVERGNGWVKSGRDGFRLDGRYLWHLVPGNLDPADHTAVLEPRGVAVNRHDLVNDILCMEFAFGGALRLDHIVGIDERRRPVAAISVGQLARPLGKHRAPVPDYVGRADTWIPELFRLTAAKVSDEGIEPLVIAIGAYLDSVVDHLDGGYLKAQVGLEAFARRLVGGGRPELLVHDEAAWREWAESVRPSIQRLLRDPQRLDTVYGKIVSAMFAPTGDLVTRALRAKGLDLPRELIAEVKKRNYPAHGFLMNRTVDHDLDADVRRLEMVQTLIAALVAGHVGYCGPLKGYDVDAAGYRPSPSWWPVATSADDAAIQYMGERSSEADMPRDVSTRAHQLRGSLQPGADPVTAATQAKVIFEDARDPIRVRWLDLELTGYVAQPHAGERLSDVLGVARGDRLAAHVSAYRRQVGTRHDQGVIEHFFVETLEELVRARQRAKSANGAQLELSFGRESGASDHPVGATFPRNVFDRVLDGFLAALHLQLGSIGRR